MTWNWSLFGYFIKIDRSKISDEETMMSVDERLIDDRAEASTEGVCGEGYYHYDDAGN